MDVRDTGYARDITGWVWMLWVLVILWMPGMPMMLGKDGMDARDTGYAMDIT